MYQILTFWMDSLLDSINTEIKTTCRMFARHSVPDVISVPYEYKFGDREHTCYVSMSYI